jgi:2-methylcitrate dehydratase PrpD
MTGLTSELGAFLANVKFEDLPAATLPLVRNGFTDTVGVIMVGITEPVVDIVRRTFADASTRREARVCLSFSYADAPEAALVGGTAAHALDYDDQSLSGHPSAVLVPAILAEAESLGRNGRELVTAYVAGYEVWAELLRRDANYHARGGIRPRCSAWSPRLRLRQCCTACRPSALPPHWRSGRPTPAGSRRTSAP